jgi:ElaB/YqjD/DUF883 family membrane-anchored ribosome-binding protein
LFVPAAIVAIVGVFIIKKRARGDARSESVLTANRTELSESLSNIVRDLEQIISDSASISTTELRNAIDDKLRNDLRRFADARESMVHLYGLQTYADIMSDFAAGERYVNRVWSAAADDYEAEALAYLHKAQAQFKDATARLEAAGRTAAVV